ncbi:MAG: hypothetical protein ACOWWH_11905 [Eubacteriaceae bacterium]
MKKFGYIINPRDAEFYSLNGKINKIKLKIPFMKEEAIKISEIYDKNNNYIGDIISCPLIEDEIIIKEKLHKYIDKNELEFICLGDALKNYNNISIIHNNLIPGIIGLKVVCMMYIAKEIIDRSISIYEAEIIIAVDNYDTIVNEFIEYISQEVNYITIIGNNITLNENLYDEVYTKNGLSLGYCPIDRFDGDWDVLINFSRSLKWQYIKKNNKNGLIIDPFTLIENKKNYRAKIIDNLGLYCEDVVFFNKLNIINNIYSPQFLESIIRCNNKIFNNEDMISLIKNEIKDREYQLI